MGKTNTRKIQTFGSELPEIMAIGRSIFDPIWAVREHAGPFCEIIHILSGRVKVRTRDYTIAGAEGDTIYTPSRKLHRDDFELGSQLEVYLVHFAWPGEKKLLKQFSPVQLAKVSPSVRRELSQDFTRLYRDFTSGLPFSRELARVRLLQIIGELCQEAAAEQSRGEESHDDYSHARRRQIMSQAKQYIQNHYSEPITLETIAAFIDISPYYLSRVFSEESGFTFCSYITQVRMENAAEFLKDERLNISEVAHRTGFKDSHYFSRVFRSHFALTPKEYRAKRLFSK